MLFVWGDTAVSAQDTVVAASAAVAGKNCEGKNLSTDASNTEEEESAEELEAAEVVDIKDSSCSFSSSFARS